MNENNWLVLECVAYGTPKRTVLFDRENFEALRKAAHLVVLHLNETTGRYFVFDNTVYLAIPHAIPRFNICYATSVMTVEYAKLMKPRTFTATLETRTIESIKELANARAHTRYTRCLEEDKYNQEKNLALFENTYPEIEKMPVEFFGVEYVLDERPL